MKDFIIILPTHSNYQGVVRNFLQLLKKNWPNCPYEIIISVAGKRFTIDGYKIIYNGANASLVDCVVNVAEKCKSKYYISFLGDAFINRKIDDRVVAEIFSEIRNNKINYCSLQCVKNYKKRKNFNKRLRFINSLDRYSHNFTAFVASQEYIMDELSKNKSDLDFEKKYLSPTIEKYYSNHLIVNKNYFKLLPSITKGKWDRINYGKLLRKNPEIEFDYRKKQSWKYSILCHLRNYFVSYLPSSMRIGAKNKVEEIFKIKFGVKG